jgi:PBSX family phage portal protein
MSSADDSGEIEVKVSGIGDGTPLAKAENSTQLSDRRIRTHGAGIKPPYNPDRLASFSELNETLSVGIRKKARYEVGYGFSIVPHVDVDAEEASDDERETIRDFWRGLDSRWQTKARQKAEPTTPEEVLELARQDYHLIGWCALEILTNMEGDPVGLAHVPANTVRVRKPQSQFDQPRHPEEGRFVDADGAEFASRGYVQIRDGRRRYFGEAGDRWRGRSEDDKREPLFVDQETGDVVTGSAEKLEHDPANELIFVTNPSPLADDYGIPDWVSAIRTITADEAAKDYNRDFFDNDTIPRMVVKVTGGELSEESREDLRQMLNGLRAESHRAVVLEVEKFLDKKDLQTEDGTDAEISIEPLGQGISEEMDFRQFREKNEHEIAKVLEVPPVKIGITESANYSNSDQQDRDFALEVIQPEQHKFAARLYQILHQKAFGIRDWTIEFELRGADQPKEDAAVARRKIQAVRGAVPVNRALEMVGEDPLPEDHEIDGDTLVANVGREAQGAPGEGPDQPPIENQLPPPDNKIAEREWAAVEADLVSKDSIEQMEFDSSNLDDGLFDFETNELYLSFQRDEGQSSLYAYVDVPATEWSALANASSHGSYHYDNIRLDYEYVEITNFHGRLPEGPMPDAEDVPDDISLLAARSAGGRDFSERQKTPSGVPDDATHIDDESECDGTVHEGPRGGLYCSPDGDNTPGSEAIQDGAPDSWNGSDEAREQLQSAVEDAVAEGATVGDALAAAREHVDNLDESGERVVAESAYIHQTETIDVGDQEVESAQVVQDALSTETSAVREASEGALNDDYVVDPAYGPEQHEAAQSFDAWRAEQDGSLLNDNTAELWGAAIDTTGNDNIPDDATADPDTVGDPLPAAEGDDPVTAIGDSVAVTREILRETFGETVPVARGVSGEFAEQIQEAAENGEDIDIEHRTLESWSTFPAHAEQFADEGEEDGVIIQTEIPVDEVWGSSHTTPGLAEEENELIVGKDGSETYSPDDIYTSDDGDMTDIYTESAEA